MKKPLTKQSPLNVALLELGLIVIGCLSILTLLYSHYFDNSLIICNISLWMSILTQRGACKRWIHFSVWIWLDQEEVMSCVLPLLHFLNKPFWAHEKGCRKMFFIQGASSWKCTSFFNG